MSRMQMEHYIDFAKYYWLRYLTMKSWSIFGKWMLGGYWGAFSFDPKQSILQSINPSIDKSFNRSKNKNKLFFTDTIEIHKSSCIVIGMLINSLYHGQCIPKVLSK